MDERGSRVIPKLTMTARVTVTPISHSWVTGCLELAFSVGKWNDSPGKIMHSVTRRRNKCWQGAEQMSQGNLVGKTFLRAFFSSEADTRKFTALVSWRGEKDCSSNVERMNVD